MPSRTPLHDAFIRRIRFGSPLSVAEYMRDCLVHPKYGFYSNRNVLKSDFLTSPDVSQVFGELVGAWASTFKPDRLVEFGAGSGALLRNALNAMSSLRSTPQRVDILETSHSLRQAQKAALSNANVHWHDQITSVLDATPGPAVIIGHEFLDALPVHVLRKHATGWREQLIDVDEDDNLRFALANGPTPASSAAGELLNRWGVSTPVAEVSLHALGVVERVASHVAQHGGAALFVDYAATKECDGDTLRAYRSHKQVSVLETPGECDITYDVDFNQIKATVEALRKPVVVHGPISQRLLLLRWGIAHRFRRLGLGIVENQKLSDIEKDQALDTLQANYHRLVDDEQMGRKFAVLAITPADVDIPDGFK